MKRKTPTVTINLGRFDLPFAAPDDEAIDDDYDRDDALERIEGELPASAIKVGRFEDEVDNFTSWKVEDHFYIYPWAGDEFEWALIRITWDDNWGRWDVESCARIAGQPDPLLAARAMLTALVASWGYDPQSSECRNWKKFIRRLSVEM